jgi:hypothetical protein
MKTTTKKKTKNTNILFLHVKKPTKKWFKALTQKMGRSEQSLGRVTQSTVASRIFDNLKKNPKLLKEALKGEGKAA